MTFKLLLLCEVLIYLSLELYVITIIITIIATIIIIVIAILANFLLKLFRYCCNLKEYVLVYNEQN